MGKEVRQNKKVEWIEPSLKKRHSMNWLVSLILVLSVYVLSIGPAFHFKLKKKISSATFFTIYKPVVALCSATPLKLIMDPYLELWRP